MVHMLRDEFKRNISSALDTDEEFFTVGGSEDCPELLCTPMDAYAPAITVSLAQVRTDFAAMADAAIYFGVKFLITKRGVPALLMEACLGFEPESRKYIKAWNKEKAKAKMCIGQQNTKKLKYRLRS